MISQLRPSITVCFLVRAPPANERAERSSGNSKHTCLEYKALALSGGLPVSIDIGDHGKEFPGNSARTVAPHKETASEGSSGWSSSPGRSCVPVLSFESKGSM